MGCVSRQDDGVATTKYECDDTLFESSVACIAWHLSAEVDCGQARTELCGGGCQISHSLGNIGNHENSFFFENP